MKAKNNQQEENDKEIYAFLVIGIVIGIAAGGLLVMIIYAGMGTSDTNNKYPGYNYNYSTMSTCWNWSGDYGKTVSNGNCNYDCDYFVDDGNKLNIICGVKK